MSASADSSMDLNYLFHRQQVERTRAGAAKSQEARDAHEALARKYELQIEQLTGEEFTFPEAEAGDQGARRTKR